MSTQTLVDKVYRLQLALVRRINDVHIFVQQSIPLLEEARKELEGSIHTKDHRYYVPAVGRTKLANRTDEELKEIYDRFISSELYENLIVTAVSQFESFLFTTLKLIISTYPQKLTRNVRGVEISRTVTLEVLLGVNTLEEVLDTIIDKRLIEVSRASPRDYLEYLGNIASIDTSDPAFLDYIEIKAARDLIVHNSCVVNNIYLAKVGKKKRGKVGEKLDIDADYFNHCIATLKRIAGIVKRDVEKNFA